LVGRVYRIGAKPDEQKGTSVKSPRVWVRLVLATAVLTAVFSGQVMAQELSTRITDTTGAMGGTLSLEFRQHPYTLEDGWQWRSTGERIRVQGDRVSAVMTFLDTLESIGDTLWEPGDRLQLQFGIDIDMRQDPTTGPTVTRSTTLTIDGRVRGRLTFISDVDDEVVVKAVSWDGKFGGTGVCVGDVCWVQYEMSGNLRDASGRGNCGDLTVKGRAVIDAGERTWQFVSSAGTDESDLAILDVRVGKDGANCFIGETEKNIKSGDVRFYYGDVVADPSLAQPFTLGEPARVMPGDNVQINVYRDIPVRLLETLDSIGDTLWDPNASPLLMTQDMDVAVRYDPVSHRVSLSGDVRGRFPSGVVAEGVISGQGVCADQDCTIQMIRTFEILDVRGSTRCGTMQLGVTVHYSHGENPVWTFDTDGTGSISLRDHPRCLLETLEREGDT
jgi:hypothetical protein